MQRLKLFIPLIIFMALAVLLWRGLGLDPNYMPSALIDQSMPQFSLPTLKDDNAVITQDEFKGKVSLVNVWATWCPSCRQEHATLLDLAAQGVPIYGVDYKDETPAARRWIRDLGDPYVLTIVDADGRLGLDLGVFGAPETYIVDKQGVIRHRHVGVVTHSAWREQLLPIVKSLQ